MAHNLPNFALRTVRSLIDVAKPRKPEFDLPIEDSMVEFLDGFVKYFPVHMKILFPMGLLLLEYGAPFFAGKLKRFSSMTFEEKDKYVQGWVESKIPIRRDLIKGVKGLCVASFYSHHEAMEHIGYDIVAHLDKVNGVGGPQKPANQEACEYFHKMHEKGLWGYDNYSGAFIREPLKPRAKSSKTATVKSSKQAAARTGKSGRKRGAKK